MLWINSHEWDDAYSECPVLVEVYVDKLSGLPTGPESTPMLVYPLPQCGRGYADVLKFTDFALEYVYYITALAGQMVLYGDP